MASGEIEMGGGKRVVDAFHFWHILPGIPLGEPGEPVRPEGFWAEPGGGNGWDCFWYFHL